MYNLLTDVWKVGPELSISLMEHFGGHIWDTYNAISELNITKAKFRPTGVWDSTATMGILNALDFKDSDSDNNDEDRIKMKETLIQLAHDGFVPLYKNPLQDPIARKISENNIGGVVKEGSVIIGLNENVWNGE